MPVRQDSRIADLAFAKLLGVRIEEKFDLKIEPPYIVSKVASSGISVDVPLLYYAAKTMPMAWSPTSGDAYSWNSLIWAAEWLGLDTIKVGLGPARAAAEIAKIASSPVILNAIRKRRQLAVEDLDG